MVPASLYGEVFAAPDLRDKAHVGNFLKRRKHLKGFAGVEMGGEPFSEIFAGTRDTISRAPDRARK